MALPPEKVRAYRPLLVALVAELLREFERELDQIETARADDSAPVITPSGDHGPDRAVDNDRR